MSELHSSPTCRVDHFGPLVVITMSGVIKADIFDGIEQAYERVTAQYKSMWTLTILNPTVTQILSDALERGASVAATWKEHLQARAIVVTSRGMSAVLSRSGVANFFMKTGADAAVMTFENLHDALDSLASSMKAQGYAITPEQSEEIAQLVKHTMIS